MKITYEWVAEHLDECGDIVDTHFADQAADLDLDLLDDVKEIHIGLVRYVQHTADTYDRQYAYVNDDGQLGAFDGGALIPDQFREEAELLARNSKRQGGEDAKV